jgi:hypothetical protein
VIADHILNAVRGLNVMEGDLGGNLHGVYPLFLTLQEQRFGDAMVAPRFDA